MNPEVKKTKEQIQALFNNDFKAKKLAIVEFIQNEANNFEDRYEIWRNTPKELTTDSGYCPNLSDFESEYGEISWYDDFSIEKYEQKDLRDLQNRRFFEDDPENVKWLCFVKNCMKEGIHTMTFDW